MTENERRKKVNLCAVDLQQTFQMFELDDSGKAIPASRNAIASVVMKYFGEQEPKDERR